VNKKQVKTVNAAFNAGVKAHLKGLPITFYKGKNEWYRRQWQSGWNSSDKKEFKDLNEGIKNLEPVTNKIKILFSTITNDLILKFKFLVLNRWFQLSCLFLMVALFTNSTGPSVITITKEVPVSQVCQVCTVRTPTTTLTNIPTLVPSQVIEPTVVSEAGLKFLLHYEGLFETLQEDVPGGNCTIGYGHLVHMNPCNGDQSESYWDHGITKANAMYLFKNDLVMFEKGVSELVTVPLNQCQFDALVSFAFNVGLGKFKGSKTTDILLTELNKGNYSIVPIELNKYVWSNGYWWDGLIKRRAAEGRIFTSCEYE
jgi:lysozyme